MSRQHLTFGECRRDLPTLHEMIAPTLAATGPSGIVIDAVNGRVVIFPLRAQTQRELYLACTVHCALEQRGVLVLA